MKKTILIIILLFSSLAHGQFWENPNQKPSLFGMRINRGHILGDPVGLWLMSERLGNKVFDLSGNGNTGPIGTGTVWASGRFGSALYYNSSLTAEVKFTQNIYDMLGIRRHATFVTWARVDKANIHNGLVSDYDTSAGFNLKITNGNKAEFYVYPNNHRITDTVNYGTNIWHQLVGVMDGANIYLYKDGILVGTDTLGEDIGDSPGVLHFGQRGDGADETEGFQDHVIIWNRALSASEIAQVYREPFCFMEPNWDMELYGWMIAPVVGAGQFININMN